MLLTRALLDRMHNNFLTLEVWSKTGGTQDDEVHEWFFSVNLTEASVGGSIYTSSGYHA